MRLWNKLTDHNPIVQVVHNINDTDHPQLDQYVKELIMAGAHVYKVPTDPEVVGCPLKSTITVRLSVD